MKTPASHRHRKGITLLEVVLALAIFLGGVAAIGQIVTVGTRAAMRAQLLGEAVALAESRMDELATGVYPLQSTSAQASLDAPGWNWLATVEPGTQPDLLVVTVTLERAVPSMALNESFSLTRIIRDPVAMQDAAAAATGSSSIMQELGL